MSEFIEELQQFIIEQAIGGKIFLNLTDQDLKDCGLSARGKRKILLELVEEAKITKRILVQTHRDFEKLLEMDIFKEIESDTKDPITSNIIPFITFWKRN
jgi:type III secretion system FlhB-like substrate exporter